MKGLKGIILGVLLAASVLMPFNVSADTYISTSNIVACHVESYERDPGSSTIYFNHVKCFFDANYEGYADFRVQYDIGGNTYTSSKLVVASGTNVEFQIDSSPGNINTGSLVTVLSISNNHMIYKSDSLIDISNMYSFPIESYNAIYYAYNQGFVIDSLFENDKYIYPIFISDNSKYVFAYSYAPNTELTVILWNGNGNVYNASSFNNRFTYNGTLVSFVTISAIAGGRFFKVIFKNETSSNINLNLKFVDNNVRFIPIFISQGEFVNIVSTDFALTFRLRNELLDNLQIIANGTSGSQSAVSDLEDNNDQMADDMDDLATIENGYNQDFNNQLQNIDFSNPIQSNQGILPAANFVISVFNGLINNNPFSLLIIVCCILLIGKKVIGK